MQRINILDAFTFPSDFIVHFDLGYYKHSRGLTQVGTALNKEWYRISLESKANSYCFCPEDLAQLEYLLDPQLPILPLTLNEEYVASSL